jgi:hypothetical protein
MIEDLDPKKVSAALDRLIEDLRTLGMHERAAELERIRKRPKPAPEPKDGGAR